MQKMQEDHRAYEEREAQLLKKLAKKGVISQTNNDIFEAEGAAWDARERGTNS